MTSTEMILHALAKQLDGEPAPSYHSDAAAAMLTAVASIQYPMDHARIGAGVLQLLVDRLRSSVAAEREVEGLTRGGSLPS